MDSYEEAVAHPTGDIVLAFCQDCGLIFNVAFDPSLTEYSSRYEETQAYSPTFNRYHHALAAGLIERHDLRHKQLTEIGCGKGEFLTLLCELGDNSGVGFDPGYIPERNRGTATEKITFIQDLFSESYAEYCGDFICCKMTLEHIAKVSEFMNMIRRSIGEAPSTVIFFQVPEAGEILKEIRFWDIYYEHCSYFSEESLRRLFTSSAFSVLRVAKSYGDQYLSIEARPAASEDPAATRGSEQIEELHECVLNFQRKAQERIHHWRSRLRLYSQEGKRTVLWGSTSKGVSFLTTLGIKEEVDSVIDINPYRQGKYMPGSGHRIVAPDSLKSCPPDLVVLMNPVYRNEIQEMLSHMSISAEVETV